MSRSAAAASSCSLRRREFPTVSGPVDYALFVDKRFCGVVEAKPAGTTLSGFSEQAARYIADAPDFLGADPRQRRFEYVASDTETLFRDLADPEPRSRRLFTFHRPETLRRWMSEPETLRARLRHMPPLVTEGLRQCQVEAITGSRRPARSRSDDHGRRQDLHRLHRILSCTGPCPREARVVSGRSPQSWQSDCDRICRLSAARHWPIVYRLRADQALATKWSAGI